MTVTAAHRRPELDRNIYLWLQECCTREADAFVTSTALWLSWRAWAARQDIHPRSQKLLTQHLMGRGYEHHKTNRANGFLSLSVNG